MIALDTARRDLHDGQRAQGRGAVQLDRRAGARRSGPGRATRCRPACSVVVVGRLAGRGRDVDRPGRQQHGDRRRQGLAHLGAARGRAAAHVLGPVAAARRELRDVRAAPRALPRGEPVGERLVRLRDRRARRHVHAPVRLRHLGPRPGLLHATPTRTSAARATARRSSSRPSAGGEQPKIPGTITSAISIHKVGRGSDPPHAARRGQAWRPHGVLGKGHPRPRTLRVALSRHRRAAARPSRP